MNTRREFVTLASLAGAAAAAARSWAAPVAPASEWAGAASALGPGYRALWIETLTKVATPVLSAMAAGKLKATMPVEALVPADRRPFTHLEALGRTLTGMAPWLELTGAEPAEERERAKLAGWARQSIGAAGDPRSPDYCNFSEGRQPLVDAAFLAQAILRAPRELWEKLTPAARANVVAGLQASRAIQPGENNWTLFAATIEAMLRRCGEKWDQARLFAGPRKFERWYVGDGWYGDGPEYHTDYYNAFVIQPMLVDVLEVIGADSAEWRAFRSAVLARLTRYAALQERLIAPDGSYPVLGRSIAYRCGAFQGLALAALRHELPAQVVPGQARAALTAVIRRTLEAPGTFDSSGWLQVGLAGHQPALGEPYISTGSLYLCSAAFLPLGLPASDPFWTDPPAPTTWQKAWGGTNLGADHALASGG